MPAKILDIIRIIYYNYLQILCKISEMTKGANMDQISSTVPVTVIPDDGERRQIRRHYNRTALILLVNMIIFNLGARLSLYIICAFYGGGVSREAVLRGQEIFQGSEFMVTLYSCIIPIAGEITAIILGTKLLSVRVKPLVTREGYGGGTVMKLITLSVGLQTAAAVITSVITYILDMFGLSGATPDISATTSFPANAVLCFYVCLLGPVLEEILYRGVLLQSMRKYNERFAIFLSAAVFGLMHQNYQQFLTAFVVGIPLAIVTIKYNSILPSIFTHIFMNTSALLFSSLLQFADPEYYDSIYSGDINAAALPSGAGLIVVIVTAVFRYGFLLAALIVGITSLVKGKNMTVPTPAGKARSSIIFSSPLWWIVFIAYLFLCFIEPFIV